MLEQTRSRLAQIPELGVRALAALSRATAAIVGVGALGGWVSWHLAMLGVGLILIDDGRCEPENLANAGFGVGDLGSPKAAARARQARNLNPECKVQPVVARIEELGLAALRGVDLIVTCTDSHAARVRAAEVSTALGIGMLDAAVDGSGSRSIGTITLFGTDATSACYACEMPGFMLARALAEEQPQQCPNWRKPGRAVTGPTLQASSFAAVTAGFQSQWAVRVLSGHGADLTGRRLIVSATQAEPRVRVVTLARNAGCALTHARLELSSSAETSTVGATARMASRALGAPVERISLHGRTLVVGLLCPECGAASAAVRVNTSISDEEARCPACSEREMAPAALRSSLEAADVARVAERTWAQLGVPGADVVTAEAAGRAVHLVVNAASAAGARGVVDTGGCGQPNKNEPAVGDDLTPRSWEELT